MNKKNQLLLSLGLLFISIAQIISHFTNFTDFVNGAFIGIGFGILIIVILKNKKTAIE